jgi:hypothetical protein|tara:strand:+ start:1147 stop:1341 length:195 start_codon:yes stop_codon:yes gene_type:complete
MTNFDNIKTIAIGAIGAGTSAGVENIASLPLIDISQATSVVTQIIILLATLIGLFKKKRVDNIK